MAPPSKAVIMVVSEFQACIQVASSGLKKSSQQWKMNNIQESTYPLSYRKSSATLSTFSPMSCLQKKRAKGQKSKEVNAIGKEDLKEKGCFFFNSPHCSKSNAVFLKEKVVSVKQHGKWKLPTETLGTGERMSQKNKHMKLRKHSLRGWRGIHRAWHHEAREMSVL